MTDAERPGWMADAACAGMDPDLFFPTRGDDTTAARAVCAACPVAAACLAYALDEHERTGVWGGLTPSQRRTITRHRRARR